MEVSSFCENFHFASSGIYSRSTVIFIIVGNRQYWYHFQDLPATLLKILHILTHLVLIITRCSRWYFPCFTDDNVEDYRYWPGWCGSVDWVSACEPKGLWFNAQSGHRPGVGQVPSWGRIRGNHTLVFLSLSFSLPSPL